MKGGPRRDVEPPRRDDEHDAALEEEVNALLAKIPSKYKREQDDQDSSSKGKRRKADWSCDPLTAFVGIGTIVALVVFLYLSMSPRPFLLRHELSGSWVVDPQGPFARRALNRSLSFHLPLEIRCHNSDGAAGSAAAAAYATTIGAGLLYVPTEEAATVVDNSVPLANTAADHVEKNMAKEQEDTLDKTRDNEYEARCVIPFGHFPIHTQIHVDPVRVVGSAWHWTGRCTDEEELKSESQEPTDLRSSSVSAEQPHLCTLSIYRRRAMLSLHLTDGVATYLLIRETERAGAERRSSWRELWNEKGRYLFILIVVIVVLKGFQMVANPKGPQERMIAIRKRKMLQRSREHAEMHARLEREGY